MDVILFGILLGFSLALATLGWLSVSPGLVGLGGVLMLVIGGALFLQPVTKTQVVAVGNTTETITASLSMPFQSSIALILVVLGLFFMASAAFSRKERDVI